MYGRHLQDLLRYLLKHRLMLTHFEHTCCSATLHTYEYIERLIEWFFHCTEGCRNIIQLNASCLHEKVSIEDMDGRCGMTSSNEEEILIVEDAAGLVVKFDSCVQCAA